MKTIKTQAELDALKEVKAGEDVVIGSETTLELKIKLSVFGSLEIRTQLETEWGTHVVAGGSAHVVAWDSAHVEAWGSAHVVAGGSAHVVAWGSAHVVAWGSAHVVAWGSAHVVAWDSAHVEAWGSAHVEARDSAHVVARDSAHVVAWDSAVTWIFSVTVKAELFGFSVAFCPLKFKAKITKKSKHAVIQRTADKGWFERNAVKKSKSVILFKRVSKDFKTQEGTPNETDWTPGKTNIHPNWKPESDECGAGKYHACSRPYFCDEFRSTPGDKYVAVRIALADLYEWKSEPRFLHKIGFRRGAVLYECDPWGEKVEQSKDSGLSKGRGK